MVNSIEKMVLLLNMLIAIKHGISMVNAILKKHGKKKYPILVKTKLSLLMSLLMERSINLLLCPEICYVNMK
jgi:hypothetical protein